MLVLRRALRFVRLEAGARRYPQVLRIGSYRSLPARWVAVALGRRMAPWMAFPMAYEARFESVLMHLHQSMVLHFLSELDLPRGARVLDIGANIGQFGVALLSVRPDLEIVSLEPNPVSRGLLERNASRHPARWSVVAAGLSSEPGPATLWYVPGRSAQGSMIRANASRGMLGSPEDEVTAVRVDLISAATLLERLSDHQRDFTLVKVDVEGYEREVIGELARLSWRYLLIEVGGTRGGVTALDAQTQLENEGLDVTLRLGHGLNGDGVRDVLFERGDTPNSRLHRL